jgi:hypothetical protein
MPTIVAATESQVLIDGKPVEGVRSIEYRSHQGRTNIYALGSAERIGVVAGPSAVEGKLTVASTHASLNGLATNTSFQVTAQLKHGTTTVSVTFDECFLLDHNFVMGAGEFGETVYTFTATRVREEVA